MYLGHGAYGVEAASRLYFNKSNKQLTLEEAALIAGIFQTPERQSPFVDMKRATSRRNVVLQRMADERYITQAQADAAKTAADRHARPAEPAAGHRAVLRRGSPQASRAPVRREGAVRKRPRGDDDARRRPAGHREPGARARAARATTSATAGGKPTRNVVAERHTDRRLQGRALEPADRRRRRRPGRRRHRAEDRRRRVSASARYHADLARDGLRVDAAHVGRRISSSPAISSTSRSPSSTRRPARATVTLEQTPLAEGALLAIDNHTGQIKAMVGGWSFTRSKFNRAVQAYRQLGSTFKPIVYTAAIDRGFTPTSILIDAPVSYSAGQRADLQPAQLRPQVRRARSRCATRSRSRATFRRSR